MQRTMRVVPTSHPTVIISWSSSTEMLYAIRCLLGFIYAPAISDVPRRATVNVPRPLAALLSL